MKSWLWGLVACLGLLAGCGGLHGGLVHRDPYPPVSLADDEEFIVEELSTKRLEELYAKSGISGWDPSLEAELRKWEHQVKFDVPIQMNKQVKAYLVYFSTERKEVIRRFLSRSTRYLPMIKTTFQEYGLPEDLAYLAMIESGFNPNACSPAGACGMWQFIKSTGLRYGLAINGRIDERRDPVKSTRAAARYLSDLYKQFGSWYLAAASYNCGERRVEQELRKNHHRNFWELSANRCLPNETKNYVPQLIAATIIAKNPERFGFDKVPDQQSLAPEELPVAQSPLDSPRLGRGNPPVASMPLHLRKKNNEPSYAQPRSKSFRQASLGRKAQQRSKTPNKNPKKQATHVTRAKGGKGTAARTNKGKATPHLASLSGYPSARRIKNRAKKNNSPRRGRVHAQKKKSNLRVISKGKRHSPALFAKRGEARYTKAKIRKKSSRKNGKLVRARRKPLLVSKAR